MLPVQNVLCQFWPHKFERIDGSIKLHMEPNMTSLLEFALKLKSPVLDHFLDSEAEDMHAPSDDNMQPDEEQALPADPAAEAATLRPLFKEDFTKYPQGKLNVAEAWNRTFGFWEADGLTFMNSKGELHFGVDNDTRQAKYLNVNGRRFTKTDLLNTVAKYLEKVELNGKHGDGYSQGVADQIGETRKGKLNFDTWLKNWALWAYKEVRKTTVDGDARKPVC